MYSEVRLTLAESVHPLASGCGGGGAAWPRFGIPSASAVGASSAAARSEAAARHAGLAVGFVIVASSPIRLFLHFLRAQDGANNLNRGEPAADGWRRAKRATQLCTLTNIQCT